MNHANLTARYRPQTFSELAGQDTVRAILSRASAENKVAPAYLFSGTRGVGKTTVARIFAKALNCARAPAAEPCNECERCRQITLGTAVDVVEIDGASNRGIADVRKLKEVVGYAPMEGRYRIFIIDEAHMLTTEAFNALLKTLEEPPSNVTFIMATTEPHKFPATIISRCQHYVFKRLSENGIEAHLAMVLGREGVAFEDSAVRLIARRAAGSVRDAMSLLGQVLALGGESLTEGDARRVLGLAGQELFFSLFRTLREGDGASVTRLVGDMLDSGLDLGFFLREMALCWRNMFILRQSGAAAASVLDIPEKDAARWREEAASFELAHIHAAWQMTVDSQRRVLTSLEPALALELLLLNIAMLPRLLPLEGLARLARTSGGNAPDSGPGPSSGPPSSPVSSPSSSPSPTLGTPPGMAGMAGMASLASLADMAAPSAELPAELPAASPGALPTESPDVSPDPPPAPASPASSEDRSWSAFLRFCKQRPDISAEFSGLLRSLSGEWKAGVLELTPESEFCAERLSSPETLDLFETLAREHYGRETRTRVLPPPPVKTAAAIRESLRENPVVLLLEKELGARLVDYGIPPTVQ
ncbi:MAG: DNA polymerase III subunit gamma/tau [Deltaproteobacteria bacterium]|jgi:DNA polymerase-3 subunit gamma/tau|nr:DNA polymerase III subunit gamma/tau [Deltaproteobacteria bacterium]